MTEAEIWEQLAALRWEREQGEPARQSQTGRLDRGGEGQSGTLALPFRDLADQDNVTHERSFPRVRAPSYRLDMAAVLTGKPCIVIARPPRGIRKPKPGPKITRVIRRPARARVGASACGRGSGKPAAKRVAVIVGRKSEPPPSPEEYEARGAAVDQLFRDLVRRTSKK